MSTNNFKKMMQEQEDAYQEPLRDVGRKVDGSINFIQHIGNVIELYVPKFMDTFIAWNAGTADRPKRKRGPQQGPQAPGGPKMP